MLLENVNYHNNLPFSISFSNVSEEDFHYHKEMEMLLILRGTTNCKIHNVSYALNEGDILIVDTQDLHRIFDSSDDILMLVMYVDLGFFTDLYPNIDYMIFACEDYGKSSTLKYQDLQKKVSILKHHIAKTMLTYINEKNNSSILMECINDLIFTLVNQFQGFFIEDNKFKADHGDINDIDLKRLYIIIKYIYLNYDKKITLDDLADIVHLNPYYISHLIKNTSGLNFQNFLNYVRVEYAEKHLVENKLTLTQISEFCGFSSLAYFNKCFKIWHNITPAQYRKQLCPCERTFHKPFSEETALSLLKPYITSYNSQKSNEILSKSSHHIFIPVKYKYLVGKNFEKTFPLKIILTSDEDVFMLNYQKEKLKELLPFCIMLDSQIFKNVLNKQKVLNTLSTLQSLGFPLQIACSNEEIDRKTENIIKTLGIPITTYMCNIINDKVEDDQTVSSALRNIIRTSQSGIRLSGQSKALFTTEGLITPFFSVYSMFSQIKGVLTEQRDQYMIIKNNKSIYILIFQEDTDSKLKAHIHIKDIRGKGFIVEKKYTKEQNCYQTLRTLNNPSIIVDSMKAHINAISSGTLKLSSFDVKDSFDINFDIGPDALTFIEIFASSTGL